MAGSLSVAPTAVFPGGNWRELGSAAGAHFDHYTRSGQSKADQVGLCFGFRVEGTSGVGVGVGVLLCVCVCVCMCVGVGVCSLV